MDWDKKIYWKDVVNFFKKHFPKKDKPLDLPDMDTLDLPDMDTLDLYDLHDLLNSISRKQIKSILDDEVSNILDEDEYWAMRNYDLAERTGLWSTNMSDGPVIDGTPLRKLK